MPLIVDQREPRHYHIGMDAVRYIPNGFGDYWLTTDMLSEEDMLRPELLRERGVLVRNYERKKLNDLWHSKNSGRLNVQLRQTDVLIVEVGDHVWRRLREDALLNVINGIAEHHIVKIAMGPDHIARMLRYDEAKMKKGEPFGVMRIPIVHNAEGSRDRRVRALHALGVGPERAMLVLKKYRGNLIDAFNDLDGWTDVKGIGPSTVQKVREFLEGVRAK